MERNPAVAGQFYSSNANVLKKEVEHFISEASIDADAVYNALSYVAAHAGYKYSGSVAGYTYKALEMKKDLKDIDTFVIIGPNHTGLGYPVSVSGVDWKMPFGTVSNDIELSGEIAAHKGMAIDEEAHSMEHSVEVQLPFLQSVVKKPKCCFICMGEQSLEYCNMLHLAISDSAKSIGRKIAIIASSDMNHYESSEDARKKDIAALDELKKMNVDGFHKKIGAIEDSACGYGPITVSAMFAKNNGAKTGRLLKYSDSGDITGDKSSVVAYPSIAFV